MDKPGSLPPKIREKEMFSNGDGGMSIERKLVDDTHKHWLNRVTG